MTQLSVFKNRVFEVRRRQRSIAVRLAVAFVVLSTAALLAGCHSANNRAGGAAQSFNPPVGTDHALINAVLDDLVVSDAFRLGGPSDPARHQLILHVQSRMPTSTLTTKKVRAEARRSQVKVTSDVCDDLVRRNSESVSLADFRPRNTKVVVRNLTGADVTRRYLAVKQFKTKYPNARGFVQTWMPGYSEDGATAIVRFRCGPPRNQGNSAGQVGTYLFSRQGDQWKIQWRMFHPVES